jgi:hypothetical protein
MEAKRVAVTPDQIDDFFCDGFRVVEGVPHISFSTWTRWGIKSGPIQPNTLIFQFRGRGRG